MDFALFLILNATLFIRPAEIVPDLLGLPIYNILILSNLAVACLKVGGRLSYSTLKSEPITACVIGFLISIFLSHASHMNFLLAREGAFDFAKIVLYYLLMVSVLDTPSRFRRFLIALVTFVVVLTALALLHYHGIVNIPSLDAVADHEIDPNTGEDTVVMRLCSTGIYNDPNDLSLILVVGMGACLFLAGARPGELPKPYWLIPALFFMYALTLTHSRGGFLAMLAGMMVLFYARFGLKKSAVLGTVTLPVMFFLFAGRQTNISAGEDTGQDRIQLWAEGFSLFRESPLFGIGQNLYQERVSLVAHNSYIHAYAELGLFGGSLFLGAFAYAMKTLLALSRQSDEIQDRELKRLPPFLLAMIVSYSFGMLTVSRNYVVPTFMILGLATAYLRLASLDAPSYAMPGGPIESVTPGLLGRMALVSLAFLVASNGFIKLFVRY